MKNFRFINLALILTCIFLNPAFGQNYFQETIRTNPSCSNCFEKILVTNDGGALITGTFAVTGTPYSFYMIKTNNQGNISWSKNFQDNVWDFFARSVDQTIDGGYVLAGSKEVSNMSKYQFLLVKTDSLGNRQWAKIIGDSGIAHALAVKQTSDRGFILAGDYDFQSGGNSYYGFVIKTDTSGNSQWTTAIPFPSSQLFSIDQTPDGGYIAVGWVNIFSRNKLNDILLAKISSSGILQWIKTIGGTEDDFGTEVHELADSSIIISGSTRSFGSASGMNDLCLIKTDKNGSVIWSKTYGGTTGAYNPTVELTADDGYILTGTSATSFSGPKDINVIKTNNTGNLIWSKNLGGAGNESGIASHETSDGSFMVCGISPPGLTTDFFLAKIDSNGIGCLMNPDPVTSVTNVVFPDTTYIFSPVSGPPVTSATPFLFDNPVSVQLIPGCLSLNSDLTDGKNSISIYPNPVKGNFTLSSSRKIDNALIQIFSIYGSTLFEEYSSINSEMVIQLDKFPTGVYILSVKNNGMQFTQKLIVQ